MEKYTYYASKNGMTVTEDMILSNKDHERLAYMLKMLRNNCISVIDENNKKFSKIFAGKLIENKIVKLIDELRDLLDSKYSEQKNNDFSVDIYYGGN